MLLGGLWHGAAWTFVAWGGLQGVALAVNGAWARRGLADAGGAGLGADARCSSWPRSCCSGRRISRRRRGCWPAMAGLDGAGRVRVHDALWSLSVASAVAAGGADEPGLSRSGGCGRWPGSAVPAGAALVGLLLLAGGRVPNEFIYFQF